MFARGSDSPFSTTPGTRRRALARDPSSENLFVDIGANPECPQSGKFLQNLIYHGSQLEPIDEAVGLAHATGAGSMFSSIFTLVASAMGAGCLPSGKDMSLAAVLGRLLGENVKDFAGPVQALGARDHGYNKLFVPRDEVMDLVALQTEALWSFMESFVRYNTLFARRARAYCLHKANHEVFEAVADFVSRKPAAYNPASDECKYGPPGPLAQDRWANSSRQSCGSVSCFAVMGHIRDGAQLCPDFQKGRSHHPKLDRMAGAIHGTNGSMAANGRLGIWFIDKADAALAALVSLFLDVYWLTVSSCHTVTRAHVSLVILMSCARYTQSRSFAELDGPVRDLSVDIVITLYGMAAVLIYMMLIGDFMSDIARSPLFDLEAGPDPAETDRERVPDRFRVGATLGPPVLDVANGRCEKPDVESSEFCWRRC
ncbi:Putative sodium-coupled neutral amino acid transporter 7 [Durusdinium trenchii]|uniref:Sodium-coupled neutral amino acid transporter 7 n=1 Tax=Durusdinium trenchii TaxID=1381693 RepID=A0ABP0JC49_9DINO